MDFEQIAREVLAEAKATDAAEDELHGDRRGDELPPELATPEGRRAWLRQALSELEDERAASTDDAAACIELEDEAPADRAVRFETSDELLVATNQGRRGWLREGRRQYDEHRAKHPRPVARGRRARLLEALRQLEEELDAERQANEAYEGYRARGVMKDGRRFGRPPDPWTPPRLPEGKLNVTDPHSRTLMGAKGYVQGYNAQMVTTEDQIVIAAEITVDAPDFGHLEPMVTAARTELANAEVTDKPEVTLARYRAARASSASCSPIHSPLTPTSGCSSGEMLYYVT